jgi:SAM-dependent methyltransferase
MEARDARETVVCNLCQAPSYRIVYAARDVSDVEVNLAERFRSSSDVTLVEQLVECTNCGLQYVNPRLKADLVLEGYSHGSDEAFVSQARSREHTFAKSLDAIERQTNGRRGRILDVGTAGGSFLRAASQRGWEVEGCEPNRWLCDWAQTHYGISVRPGTVVEQAYPASEFDVVSLWDVLEHTPDPKSLILECHRLLKPNGLLVVNYPDIGSWVARLMGRSWVFLLDVHLYYFTRATLRRLLADAGFTVSLTRPHYQWLELGYVLRRARPYVGIPALLAERASSSVGLHKWRIPYWIGQTLVIARKSGTSRTILVHSR